jgi:uncharacterized protein (DUF934 family)
MHDAKAPQNMLRGDVIGRDDTRLFESAPEAPTPADEPGWFVTLATWIAYQSPLRARLHGVGILLQPDDEVGQLADSDTGTIDPSGITCLAVNFPVYTDGRGLSLAQHLRGDLGWRGELRAVGDVLIDTVNYLARCGFDSFVLKPGHDPLQARQALRAFTVTYQRSYRAAGTVP